MAEQSSNLETIIENHGSNFGIILAILLVVIGIGIFLYKKYQQKTPISKSNSYKQELSSTNVKVPFLLYIIITAETLDYFKISKGSINIDTLKDCSRRAIGFRFCKVSNTDIQSQIANLKLGGDPDRSTTNSTLLIIKGKGITNLENVQNQLDLYDALATKNFDADSLDYKEILHFQDVDVFYQR